MRKSRGEEARKEDRRGGKKGVCLEGAVAVVDLLFWLADDDAQKLLKSTRKFDSPFSNETWLNETISMCRVHWCSFRCAERVGR